MPDQMKGKLGGMMSKLYTVNSLLNAAEASGQILEWFTKLNQD